MSYRIANSPLAALVKPAGSSLKTIRRGYMASTIQPSSTRAALGMGPSCARAFAAVETGRPSRGDVATFERATAVVAATATRSVRSAIDDLGMVLSRYDVEFLEARCRVLMVLLSILPDGVGSVGGERPWRSLFCVDSRLPWNPPVFREGMKLACRTIDRYLSFSSRVNRVRLRSRQSLL